MHYIFDNIPSSFSNSVKLFKDKEDKMATFLLGPQRLWSHHRPKFFLMHIANSKDEISFFSAKMAW